MTAGENPAHCERLVVDGVRVYSLHQINALPTGIKEGIYRRLLPLQALSEWGIDPQTLCDEQGNCLVTFTCPNGSRIVEVDVRPRAGFPDPLLYLELTDNRLGQIEVMLFVVNDPHSERFETDRDWRGERTEFGTLRRNVPEEILAMEAGLAPGQVRQGLRLSRVLVPLFEDFVQCLGHDYYLMEPLAYHNAILFERLGCNYVQGLRKMQWLDATFRPGSAMSRPPASRP